MRADLVPGDGPDAEPALAGVEISPMRRRHLRSVIRIEAQAENRGWSVGLYLSELRREQAHLTALEAEQRSYIEQIATAENAAVLEMRARQQGLVRPGERAFRLVTAFDTDPADVDRFLSFAKSA